MPTDLSDPMSLHYGRSSSIFQHMKYQMYGAYLHEN